MKEFRQGLTRDLGADCRIVEHVWLFNTLRLRELQEIAADEASASDLDHHFRARSEALPDEVRDWIEMWVRRIVRHPAVLLALLDPAEEGTSNPLQAYLQKVASRGGMEFLVE